MSGPHDLCYKDLFAHAELVRNLLHAFTAHAWIAQLPIDAFERINPVYVSERPSERQSDTVWRIRLGEASIVLLLEFQAQADRWMALRMQVYAGLLYQDLVKHKPTRLPAGLPPLLPVVFYHGQACWHAATSLSDLAGKVPPGMAVFQPEQRYLLIDQRRLDTHTLACNPTLLAQLFQLELCGTPDVLVRCLRRLRVWLEQTPPGPLRSTVFRWVMRLIARRFPLQGTIDTNHLDQISWQEVCKMFDFEIETFAQAMERENRAKWTREALEQGKVQGLQQGMQQGMQQGQLVAARAIIKSLLSHHLGTLTADMAQRIDAAPDNLIRHCVAHIADGAALAAAFAAPATP